MKKIYLKTEEYRRFKIYFRPLSIGNYKIAAQVPKITSQALGVGRTKEIAFEEAKNAIDNYIGRKLYWKKNNKKNINI